MTTSTPASPLPESGSPKSASETSPCVACAKQLDASEQSLALVQRSLVDLQRSLADRQNSDEQLRTQLRSLTATLAREFTSVQSELQQRPTRSELDTVKNQCASLKRMVEVMRDELNRRTQRPSR